MITIFQYFNAIVLHSWKFNINNTRREKFRENKFSQIFCDTATITHATLRLKSLQDGRPLAALFSPSYKFFDQLVQTVKSETTALNLVFKGFLQTLISPLISIFYAK